MNRLELKTLIRGLLREELERSQLVESSLTAEEKVDAWHNGTRRENYKAAGVPKLNAYREIAIRKGYDEIVSIIDDELARRGTTPTTTSATKSAAVVSAPPPPPAPASTSSEVTAAEPTVLSAPTAEEEPAHFSDELVNDVEVTSAPKIITLTDKEKELLVGKAIAALGKPAFYVRSYWKTAMGFIGSYTHKWFNGNFNEIKADRASDKAVDLTYDSSKLIVLRKDIEAGYRNVDRYYSIEIPSSTYYIVDRAKIRKNASDYYTYYDSELDWRFSTLNKTNANRKKFKQYLIETVGMPEGQAEELTADAFDNNRW